MNALVAALSKGKSQPQAEEYGGDLHTRKSSHISVPMESTEFHFSAGDMNLQAQTNQTYLLCVGVVCSSADAHDVRFKQITKPYLEDQRPFEDGANKGNSQDAPLDQETPMVRSQIQQVA